MPIEIAILPFLMLLISGIFKFFPPKKINYFYGYRTPRSMKNQETWDKANKFSADLMLKISIIFAIIFILINHFFEKTALLISIIFLLIGLVSIFILTEIRLEKLFDKDGNRKNNP